MTQLFVGLKGEQSASVSYAIPAPGMLGTVLTFGKVLLEIRAEALSFPSGLLALIEANGVQPP